MKHKSLYVIVFVLLAVALVSCDAMLGINLFAKDMTSTPDELSKKTTQELMDEAGPQFFEMLVADETGELTAAVLANLTNTYETSTDTEEVADAALLIVQVELATSPAGQLINGALTSLVGVDPAETSDPVSVFAQILPVSVLNPAFVGSEITVDNIGEAVNEEEFLDMIEQMTASLEYYQTISTNLEDGEYPPEVISEVAMGAIFSSVITSIDTPDGYVGTQGDFLYELISGTYVGDAPELDFSIDPSISNLVDVAGLSGLIDLIPTPTTEPN
jgi:hypothetical protein